jgi:hypothetical protein
MLNVISFSGQCNLRIFPEERKKILALEVAKTHE